MKKIVSLLLAALALLTLCVPAFAASAQEPGVYAIDAALYCYVDAMGGIDFGKNLLKDARVTVKDDGSAEATLYLTTENITIYGVTVDTYVDAAASPIGYYDAAGVLHKDAAYTENDTLANVKFVDSITIPVTPGVDSVTLYLYINSGFMGVQFCDGSGTAGSGKPDTLTKYKGFVTFDWDSLKDGGGEIDRGETCPYCGKLHTGFFGGLQMFFHKLFFFIQSLFHK